MPPSESTRRVIYNDVDEVDDHVRSRRLERARRTLTADGFDVLSASAEFTWETPKGGWRDRAPRPEVIHGAIAERSGDHAWRAAAQARHASPRAVEQSLDEWGDRVAAGPDRLDTTGSDRLDTTGSDRLDTTGSDRLGTAAVPDRLDTTGSDRYAPVAAGQRRTVVITGRGAERYPLPRRGYSANLRPYERAGFRPDRVAMWAVLLCLALVLVAATSSHAAVLGFHAALHATP